MMITYWIKILHWRKKFAKINKQRGLEFSRKHKFNKKNIVTKKVSFPISATYLRSNTFPIYSTSHVYCKRKKAIVTHTNSIDAIYFLLQILYMNTTKRKECTLAIFWHMFCFIVSISRLTRITMGLLNSRNWKKR